LSFSASSLSVVAVSRQRELLTLLGLEEGVGQSDGVHAGHPRVLVELRVDVEEDGHVDLLVRVQTLLLEAETLDLVEVLSRIKGHHVVGGDADDGFVCWVSGSVEGERRLTWNHKDLRLLRPEVPLDAGVRVGVERDLDDAFLHRRHRLHQICIVAGHRRAAEPGRLAVESVERHCSVRQADHPHPGGDDVRQHRLVPGFPLFLLALALPLSVLGATALSVEAERKPPPQEVLILRVKHLRSIAPKRPDASQEQHRRLRAAEGLTHQQRQQHCSYCSQATPEAESAGSNSPSKLSSAVIHRRSETHITKHV